MKHLILVLTLLCGVRHVLSDDVRPRQIHSNDEEELDTASLPKEISDRYAWLHPGLSRAEIEKHWEIDGGLHTWLEQVYCLKAPIIHAKFVKLELAFQPVGMPDEVYADRSKAIKWTLNHKMEWKPTDILRSVSKPYLGPSIID